ncbi:MAG: hypothetical protein IMZ58_07640 [Thermoplasmata archaeon]|nr:hypothetical protein [Thermoplasmata archaeon]
MVFDINNDFFVTKIKNCAEMLSQDELDQLQGLIKKVEILKPSKSEYIVISKIDNPRLFNTIKEKKLEIWTIYNSPADYPGKFVARKWILDMPTKTVIVGDSLDEVRNKLPNKPNLVRFDRSFQDDPIIVETWL